MPSTQQPDYLSERNALVDEIERDGIRDPEVLRAIRAVPREAFLPTNLRDFAYRNTALPIGMGQTISQPYIVALMAEALRLKPSDRVLEIGTGSGYAAAVLSRLAREVYSVERHRELAEVAERSLQDASCKNVHLLYGDGTKGWAEFAPYDAISVTACAQQIPQPLLDQLVLGGRLVMPLGTLGSQQLACFLKNGEDEYTVEKLVGVRFVPLVADEPVDTS